MGLTSTSVLAPGWPPTGDAWERSPRWQRPFRFLGAVLSRVFVEPVVEGRFRIVDWPRGLVIIGMVVTLAYVTAAALTLAAPWLRSHTTLHLSSVSGVATPAEMSWVTIGLSVLAVAVFQTGALHVIWWVRVAAWAISSAFMLNVAGLPLTLTGLAAAIGSSLALAVFQVIRWKGQFHWWEYVVVCACFVGPLLAASRALMFSRSAGGGAALELALMMPQIEMAAAPVAILAGYAIAEWAFSTVVWSVDLGRRRAPRWLIWIILIGLLVWRLGAEWDGFSRELLTFTTLGVPVAIIVATVLLWVVLDRIADRRAPGSTRLADLSGDLRSVALPVALVMSVDNMFSGMVDLPLRNILAAFPVPGVGAALDLIQVGLRSDVATVIITLALLAWAVRLAWRADRGRAELVAAMAVLQVVLRTVGFGRGADLVGFYLINALALLLIVLVLARRMTPVRTNGMLVAVGLITIWSTRSLFDNPLEVILGGSAALLLGLVWNFLTSGEGANEDSRAFPRANRVCLLLANSLIGMVVLAFHRTTLGWHTVMEDQQNTGDQVLGGALILGAVVAVAGAVLRHEDLAGTAANEPLEAVPVAGTD